MPTRPEISELLQRIAQGDESAVQEFGREYLPRFESQARHAGVRVGDSDDVAQEVLLATVTQIRKGQLRSEDAFGSWLHTIIQRKIADHFRTHKHDRNSVSLQSPSSSGNNAIPLSESLAARSADLVVVTGVHKALNAMPADLRWILLLRHEEGFTLKEISGALDMPMSTVYRKLCEAEELFRRLIVGDDTSDTEADVTPNHSSGEDRDE